MKALLHTIENVTVVEQLVKDQPMRVPPPPITAPSTSQSDDPESGQDEQPGKSQAKKKPTIGMWLAKSAPRPPTDQPRQSRED